MVKVAVVKCSDYDTGKVISAVKESLNLINYKVPKGKKILLKPNVLGQNKPETAIDTHPAVIDAICTIFSGNELWIGDSGGITAYGGTRQAFEVSGIADIARKHKARLISFEASKEKHVIVDQNNKVLKKFTIAKEPFMVDLIINVPKLKTHMLTKYTGAVKNMFGCIPGGGKSQKHAIAPTEESFSNCLLDIYTHVKPHLNIMDGIIGIEGNGPGSGGTPKKAGLILASEDAVALDIVASKTIGYNPLDIKTIRYAIERGIFPGLSAVEKRGDEAFIEFKKPATAGRRKLPKFLMKFAFSLASIKPYIVKKRCRKCGVCRTACPVKAISLKPYPIFDRKKCILCYCCHENCPYKAIYLHKSTVIKAYQKVKGWQSNKI